MKLLLSDATIKMHQQSAKEQGLTLDDIVERETLFLPDQKTAEFRNQKIDGDKATLEMKDASGHLEYGQFCQRRRHLETGQTKFCQSDDRAKRSGQ